MNEEYTLQRYESYRTFIYIQTVRLWVAEGDAKGLKNRLNGLDFLGEVCVSLVRSFHCLFVVNIQRGGMVSAELKFGPQIGELLHDILFIHRFKSIAAKTVREGIDADQGRWGWKIGNVISRGQWAWGHKE